MTSYGFELLLIIINNENILLFLKTILKQKTIKKQKLKL